MKVGIVNPEPGLVQSRKELPACRCAPQRKTKIAPIAGAPRIGGNTAPEVRIDTDYKCYNAWA
jgi:hypothetical protein